MKRPITFAALLVALTACGPNNASGSNTAFGSNTASGSNTAQPKLVGSSATAPTPSAAAGLACGRTTSTTNDLKAVATIISASPSFQIIDLAESVSIDEAVATDHALLTQITAVRSVNQAPYNVIPTKEGSTNTAHGNAAFWSGLEIDLADGPTVTQYLSFGSADALQPVDEPTFEPLIGACALVITGQGDPKLVAVATDLAAPPVALDPSLSEIVAAAPTLEALGS